MPIGTRPSIIRSDGANKSAIKSNTTSALMNQAKYGIKYNSTIQSKLATSPDRQRTGTDRQQAMQDQFSTIRGRGKNANDLFMKAVQKRKDLDAAAKSTQQIGETAQATLGDQQRQGGVKNQASSGGPNLGARNLGQTNFRSEIINRAKNYLGVDYSLGGGHQPNATTPSRGYNGIYGLDCSGLTGIVYRQMGINLPGVSGGQSVYGRRTNINNARPGDLVGWNKGGHIAIYIGNGQIISAPRPGQKVYIRNIFRGEAVYAVALTLPGD